MDSKLLTVFGRSCWKRARKLTQLPVKPPIGSLEEFMIRYMMILDVCARLVFCLCFWILSETVASTKYRLRHNICDYGCVEEIWIIKFSELVLQGHTLTRKLNSDGRVDSLQTLHNLNEGLLGNMWTDVFLLLCICLL